MRSIISAIVLSAALAALTFSAPDTAEAAKKQSGMGVGQCWIEGTVHPAGPGEAISSCCLEDGCWICNSTWGDCVWDPKVRKTGGAGAVTGTKGGAKEPVRGTVKKDFNPAPGQTLRRQ